LQANIGIKEFLSNLCFQTASAVHLKYYLYAMYTIDTEITDIFRQKQTANPLKQQKS
jgi:hypothetical protein